MHDKVIVVLAEGIETKEEYDFLYNAVVDFFKDIIGDGLVNLFCV